MTEKRRFPYAGVALMLILAGALLLRVQQWYPFHVPDENTLLAMTLGLFFITFPVGLQVLPGYPPLFPYLNFLLGLIYVRVLLFCGLINFPFQFLHADWGGVFIQQAGRLVVALLGTLHVFFAFQIGRRFYDRSVGLMAALLLAANPFLIFNGHIFKSDVPLALLLTICLYFLLAFVAAPRRFANLWGFALFLGLSVAAKFNSVVEILLLLPVFFLVRREIRGSSWLKALAALVGGGLLGFFLGAPNWLWHLPNSFLEAYKYVKGIYTSFSFYDKASNSYLRYVGDFVDSFGPVLLAAFLVGLVLALVKKRKFDLLIAAYFLIYFVLQGNTGFYGNRMALPLYSAMALLIARAIFLDLLPLLKKWPRLLLAGKAGAWILVLIWAGGHARASLKNLNLLATDKQMEAALVYRQKHLAGKFRFAREGFTPGLAGDAGRWDLLESPLADFRRRGSFQFLSTGLLSDYLLKRTARTDLGREIAERLREYRPFHRIHKARFSPWDGDIIFWYRPPPEFRRYVVMQQPPTGRLAHPPTGTLTQPPAGRLAHPVTLPRIFYQPTAETNTLFFPLQTYEKNPAFGRLEKGFFGKWLYSLEKITAIDLFLFAPQGPVDLEIQVNGKTVASSTVPSGRLTRLKIAGFSPKGLQDDFLYALEIRSQSKIKECSFCFFPAYEQRGRASASPQENGAEEIPALFAPGKPPAWMQRFFRRTGIDLSLLDQVSREILYQNSQESIRDWRSDYFPLQRGCYQLTFLVRKLLPDTPTLPRLALKIFIHSPAGEKMQSAEVPWNKDGQALKLPLSIDDELSFVQILGDDWRQNNLLVNEISIRPDFRAMVTDAVH